MWRQAAQTGVHGCCITGQTVNHHHPLRTAWRSEPEPGTLGAMSAPSTERIWEVFRQEAEGDPMVHSGNVNAPDEELAMHYAREMYGRRGESHRLWIVAREAITELDEPDMLRPPMDRSHKKPGGYVIKHKLEAARARATEPGE